ncbi:hypothetical protein [Spirosoma fluviale]|uniref:Uncharacterized protein n=1 Tax=Spirosoma fluviale TaxID=1597977 RepID=A0A286GI64_9BACT|nr:hypothetical protein [Spirosoma fluviale]SOD95221.1 hypothetical protein SAMN06269250_4783 [Spirosoma fluviale]
MKQASIVGVMLAGIISAVLLPPFPRTDISNGVIHAKVYLPDSAKGYYQGVRFDWSGVMASLTFSGHSISLLHPTTVRFEIADLSGT